MTDNSGLYWIISAFLIVLIFGAVAYPSSYLGRRLRHRKLLMFRKNNHSTNNIRQMENKIEDGDVLSHIKKLTAKEEMLYGKENLSDEDIRELHEAKTELDQYWDLLHQRRALRDAGENPAKAEMRSSDTINKYVK